jgi:hypothetical protein
VPVESVYAVFEVKPEFNSDYLTAARQKVASVRKLERTSQAVMHKGGKYEAVDIKLRPIIGGILTTRRGLEHPLKKLEESQPDAGGNEFLNIGICLDQFAFDYTPSITNHDVQTELDTHFGGDQLIHFCIRLFRQLQAIGTVPAVDMTKYEETVFSRS